MEAVDPKSLFLRVGVFSAERWGEEVRRELEAGLLLRAADAYAVGEVMGPGVAGECAERAGLHLQEDHFIGEVVDPATGAALPRGATGELVLTTLTREAFPLLRYRTGDLTRIDHEPCACGRTLGRIARVGARTDDMLSVRGVHFFPAQVAAVLAAVEGAQPRFVLALQREAYSFKTVDAVDDVIAFYENELAGAGFEVRRTATQVSGPGSTVILSAQDAGSKRTAQVTATATTEGTTIALLFEDKK